MEQNIEKTISEAAKDLFLRKGYQETSMGDIAAAVGLTRPALHYYFRTKERLFQSVFGEILMAFLPKIKEIITSEHQLEDKIRLITDAYFEVLSDMPELPLFIMKEAHRDPDNLLSIAASQNIINLGHSVLEVLGDMMEKGTIRKIPYIEIIYTFYGLTTFPFLSKPAAEKIAGVEPVREELDNRWKECIVSQMLHLLKP